MLNRVRAGRGEAPLQLAPAQSHGVGTCVGSIGHSTAMARSGTIWHINPSYPRASFPHNICVTHGWLGENVGASSSGNVLLDLKDLQHAMMGEAHGASACASTVNHACNILNPAFHTIGIGIYVANSTTWLTEDFIG